MKYIQPIIKVGLLACKEIILNLEDKYLFNNDITISGIIIVKHIKDKIELKFKDKKYITNKINLIPYDILKNKFTVKDVTIGIDFHWERKEDQTFSGSIDFIIEENKIRLINNVALEDYLVSVISSEMKPNASLEFMKSHAIISRSWLLAQIEKKNKITNQNYISTQITPNEYIKWYDREDHTNFDVCADDHCQRYQGITKVISEKAKKAIDQTYGIVLKCENESAMLDFQNVVEAYRKF